MRIKVDQLFSDMKLPQCRARKHQFCQCLEHHHRTFPLRNTGLLVPSSHAARRTSWSLSVVQNVLDICQVTCDKTTWDSSVSDWPQHRSKTSMSGSACIVLHCPGLRDANGDAFAQSFLDTFYAQHCTVLGPLQ